MVEDPPAVDDAESDGGTPATRLSNAGDGYDFRPSHSIWLGAFFLVGALVLLGVAYAVMFRPQTVPTLRLFDTAGHERLLASLVAVGLLAAAGFPAAVQGRRYRTNFGFDKATQEAAPGRPWTWRADWSAGVLRPLREGTVAAPLALVVIALLAALPALEQFVHDPKFEAGEGRLAAVVNLVVAAVSALIAIARVRRGTPRATLRLAGETGVIGGPLEGALVFPEPRAATAPALLLRLVAEEHRRIERKRDNETHIEHRTIARFEDTQKSRAESTLAAVRFAIPLDAPRQSRDHRSPMIRWLLEVTDPATGASWRYFVPVFETAESRDDFALPQTAGDRHLSEETPEEVLQRCGVKLAREGDRLTLTTPPFQNGLMATLLAAFGIACLVGATLSAGGVIEAMQGGGRGGGRAIARGIQIVFTIGFSGLFALVGLLLLALAISETLFTRSLTIEGTRVIIRRSLVGTRWLGLARRRELSADDVVGFGHTSKTGTTGQRGCRRNLALETTQRGPRNRPVYRTALGSMPDEAHHAARALLSEWLQIDSTDKLEDDFADVQAELEGRESNDERRLVN